MSLIMYGIARGTFRAENDKAKELIIFSKYKFRVNLGREHFRYLIRYLLFDVMWLCNMFWDYERRVCFNMCRRNESAAVTNKNIYVRSLL